MPLWNNLPPWNLKWAIVQQKYLSHYSQYWDPNRDVRLFLGSKPRVRPHLLYRWCFFVESLRVGLKLSILTYKGPRYHFHRVEGSKGRSLLQTTLWTPHGWGDREHTFSSSLPQLHWRKPVQLFFSPTPVPLKVKPWGGMKLGCACFPQCEMETFLANDNTFLSNKMTHIYSSLRKIGGWVANMSDYILPEIGLSDISVILLTISQPVKWAERALHVTVSILN